MLFGVSLRSAILVAESGGVGLRLAWGLGVVLLIVPALRGAAGKVRLTRALLALVMANGSSEGQVLVVGCRERNE